MRAMMLVCSLVVLACDAGRPEQSFRNGESSGGDSETGVPVQVYPLKPSVIDTSHCTCDPKAPACGPGLDCVQLPGEAEEWRCLAKCYGTNESGGGYITTCAMNGQPVACFQADAPGGDAYCGACTTCSPVDPLSLVCQ